MNPVAKFLLGKPGLSQRIGGPSGHSSNRETWRFAENP